MSMSNKKSFTLIELIIAIWLFGVGLIAVFVVLTNGFKTMAQARWQVVAINLAREGVEMMLNVRDTNLRKWAGKKDQCWLNARSIFTVDDSLCENETWIGSGIGSIPTYASGGNSKVPVIIPFSSDLNISNGIDSLAAEWMYELMLNTGWSFTSAIYFSGSNWVNCYNVVSGQLSSSTSCLPRSYSPAGRFYRIIKNIKLADKHPTTTGGRILTCANGASTDVSTGQPCWTSLAKELRFCSEVQYQVDKANRTVTMCSVMTNFKE